MENDLKTLMKNTRIKHGITQQQLAHLLNTSRSTISNYETGLRNPDSGYLHKFCLCFKISADYLLGFKRNPSLEPTSYDFSEEELELITQILNDKEMYSLMHNLLKEPTQKNLLFKIGDLLHHELGSSQK